MAVTKNAARTASAQQRAVRRPDALPIFVWEGNDKRGVKMKGELAAKSANLVKAMENMQAAVDALAKPAAAEAQPPMERALDDLKKELAEVAESRQISPKGHRFRKDSRAPSGSTTPAAGGFGRRRDRGGSLRTLTYLSLRANRSPSVPKPPSRASCWRYSR